MDDYTRRASLLCWLVARLPADCVRDKTGHANPVGSDVTVAVAGLLEPTTCIYARIEVGGCLDFRKGYPIYRLTNYNRIIGDPHRLHSSAPLPANVLSVTLPLTHTSAPVLFVTRGPMTPSPA